MAILKKEELFELIKNRIGDDTSDDALTLIENLTDTVNDYESRINDAGDWKTKYEELDTSWRTKYKERFFSGVEQADHDDVDDLDDGEEAPIIKSFDELFEEE